MFKSVSPGRSPAATSVGVSRSMRGNRSSGTKPELLMSRLLRRNISKNNLPGKPEFIFQKEKIAVFLHGCFWHQCPQCAFRLPKTNSDFWARKFDRNRERDQLVRKKLEVGGWKVIEIWEHELRGEPFKVRERILKTRRMISEALQGTGN